jgi:exopolysaccharide biosynthesis polyprenyl glycosylphosphotransferase
MTLSKQTSKKLSSLFSSYLIDCGIFLLGFALAVFLRFHEFGEMKRMLPSILTGVLVFGASAYMFGIYSTRPVVEKRGRVIAKLLIVVAAGMLAILAASYINYSGRIGRGVMMMAIAFITFGVYIHRFWTDAMFERRPEHTLFVIWRKSDLDLFDFFRSLPIGPMNRVSILTNLKNLDLGDTPNLGSIGNLSAICRDKEVSRVVCSEEFLQSEVNHPIWRRARYEGIEVSSMVNYCEELFQFTPVNLITPNWLISACVAPQAFYIRKAKRLTDLAAATVLGVVLMPVLLSAIIAVKLTSDGPAFFVQQRVGRFGKLFNLYKLRSMRTDAEVSGAVWTADGDDPRQTTIGRWLRKYRIDEIPQLWNVWKGEMSLVGPRPERPEFTGKLADEIPFYDERHFVAPGLTGWAQVSYPYGASVQDSQHKLEYDLFYIKHMNQFFDFSILVETVRIVLTGGLSRVNASSDRPWLQASMSYSKRTSSEAVAFPENAAHNLAFSEEG